MKIRINSLAYASKLSILNKNVSIISWSWSAFANSVYARDHCPFCRLVSATWRRNPSLPKVCTFKLLTSLDYMKSTQIIKHSISISLILGEKVLCFHGPLIYEAKCLKSSVSKEKHVKYLIHYAGWNKKYDLERFSLYKSSNFNWISLDDRNIWYKMIFLILFEFINRSRIVLYDFVHDAFLKLQLGRMGTWK